jgi:death-on-curing protein
VNEPVWVLDAAVLIAHEISLANFGGADGIRDAGLLESALAKPRNLFAYGKPSLFEMAASYCYGIIKNHPFVDGNKRTGFLVGATFLEINGWRLSATEAEATEAIISVAAGIKSEAELATWFGQHCVSVWST